MKGHKEISNSDDVIDSRDVIERINFLESDEESLDEEGKTELKVLKELEEEASGSPDWKYGETLIRDSYFEDYARELADDIGAVDSKAGWPNNCIDWEKAAEELQQDYMSVNFDGIDYWIRA